MFMMPSIGPDMIISPKKLEGIDSATLAKFLSDNNKALIQRINDMIKEQLLKGEVDGCEPAFAADPDFKAKWFGKWYTALRNRLCFNSSKGSGLSLVFPIAVYLHDAYGLTCSKLLLGTEMPVVPPTWVQNWLTLAGKLTMEETSQLYDIFDLSSPEKADLVFTLKSRILEMAAERGARPDEFFMYPGLLEFDVSAIRAFASASFSETGNAYLDMKPYLGNHKMLRMVICMSVLYQVSPDYLLLQDYSSFAVMPSGRYYDPASRDMLSRLLLADEATRAKAVGYVFAAATRRLEAGGSLPVAIRSQQEKTAAEGENKSLNVMAQFSAGSGTATKKEIEAQIVASIKPKMLAVLALSDVPVSSARLHEVVDGHNRLARKALTELEKEGKVERIPAERGAATWRLPKK